MLMPERDEPSNPEEDIQLFNRFWELFYPRHFEELAKQIFWLHERYGYTMVEISKRFGISKSTAHDKLTQLKAQCLERLEQTTQTDENHAQA